MPPQPPRGGPRQRILPTPRGVNMIVWSLDNRFVLAAIMGEMIIDTSVTLYILTERDVFITQKIKERKRCVP